MSKLDKTQREYITNRIHNEAYSAIAKANGKLPIAYTSEEVAAKLVAKGFTVDDARYVRGLTLAPSAAMVANVQKRAEFAEKVRAEEAAAVDEIMLGDAEGALAVLTEFTRRISKL